MRAGLIAVTLLAVGCGGHSGKPAPSIADLVARGHLTGCESGSELYTRENTTCGDVDVATFTSNANRDKWLTVARGFGGVFVVGDRWAVKTNTQASAESLRQQLGGTVS